MIQAPLFLSDNFIFRLQNQLFLKLFWPKGYLSLSVYSYFQYISFLAKIDLWLSNYQSQLA